jgi:NADH-quinone oxidoreductase subunit N
VNFLSIYSILPELFILLMSCAILMTGVFSKHGAPRASFYLTQLTLILALLLTGHVFAALSPSSFYAFDRLLVVDKLSFTLHLFILMAMFFTFWYSRAYNEDHHIPANEFYVLGLLATIGMMILVSSQNFLTLFLGLELMSLPVYAMVALMREKSRCVEAAMKYFVIGSVASGMLLYGLSLFFGATHSLDLSRVSQGMIVMMQNQQLILYFALVFVIAGIAFKLGAAPFHVWVPDVYDGAPNSVTLFISAAPKMAAFGLALRFLTEAVPGLSIQWEHVLIVMAILSIAIGNVVAVVQSNIKRLLAYSSIAHIGYMLLGLACGTARGDAAAYFYMITYALTSLGAFGMITLLSQSGMEMNELSDFSGFSNRNPWLAFMMLIMMFSLAGIPPFVGFIAKVGVLEALIKVHSVWLAVVAIIFSIIGSYYYIRVVKVMYFEEDKSTVKKSIVVSQSLVAAASMNGLLLLLLGIFPTQLFILCHAVFAV